MSDNEFISKLLKQGYKVPLIVVRTWGSSLGKSQHHGKFNRRRQVEAWLNCAEKVKGKHIAPFPEFLMFFKLDRERKMQCSE